MSETTEVCDGGFVPREGSPLLFNSVQRVDRRVDISVAGVYQVSVGMT